MQPGAAQDVLDAPVLQLGQQQAGLALGFGRAAVGHARQVVLHAAHQRHQRAGQGGVEHQQLHHARGGDHVAVDLAVHLQRRDAAQDGRPAVELACVGVERLALRRARLAAWRHGLVLVKAHVQHARHVVGALQLAAQAHEVQCLVHQHGVLGHAAHQVRAVLDPLEELFGAAFEHAVVQVAQQRQPGEVDGLPQLGGQAAAHGARVLAAGAQAGVDGGGVVGVARHVVDHGLRLRGAVARGEVALQLEQAQHGLPRLAVHRLVARQQGQLGVDVQHARGVFGALDVAAHPEKMVGGTAQHGLVLLFMLFFMASFLQHPGVLGAAALAAVDHQRALLERHAAQATGHGADFLAAQHVGPQVHVARRHA